MSPFELIGSSQMAAVVTNPRLPDNPIVECNEPFLALTGYERSEIIGRNCRFLVGPETEPSLTQALRDGIAQCRPVMVDIRNYKKDGTPFRNAVMIAPIFGDDGQVEYFLGSQVELEEDAASAGASSGSKAAKKVQALSPRQREVLIEVAKGKLNKQIAHELDLTERTIKMHRAALLDALNVRTNAEAIRIAIEAGY